MNLSMASVNYSALDANRDYFRATLPFAIVWGLLSVIGIFGNSFVLYVYAFKYPLCNFKYFVQVLGTIDLLSCILTIPGEVYTQYTWFTMPSVELCKAKSYFNTATVTCSSVVLLLISIDRFRKICCPHGWQVRPVHAFRLSAGLSVVSFIYTSPAIIFCGPQTYDMDFKGGNVTVTICLKDDTYKNTSWPSSVMNYGYVTPNVAIMVIVLILYGLIAKSIFKRTDQKRMQQKISTLNRTMTYSKERQNAFENSETWNELSIVDSEFGTLRHSVGEGQRQSKEFSITPEGTIDRSIRTDLPCSSLQVPKLKKRRVIKSSPRIRRRRQNSKNYAKVVRRRSYARLRRKTLIMFILTIFFIVSTSLYFTLASQMSDKGVFFKNMSLLQEIIVMFFFRFYYFNSLINAMVYGLLDPRFRRAVRRASRRMSRSMTSFLHS